jgi:hypothetical protein
VPDGVPPSLLVPGFAALLSAAVATVPTASAMERCRSLVECR